jgi:hypothetical protein
LDTLNLKIAIYIFIKSLYETWYCSGGDYNEIRCYVLWQTDIIISKEDGGHMFLQNNNTYPLNYLISHPSKQYISKYQTSLPAQPT